MRGNNNKRRKQKGGKDWSKKIWQVRRGERKLQKFVYGALSSSDWQWRKTNASGMIFEEGKLRGPGLHGLMDDQLQQLEKVDSNNSRSRRIQLSINLTFSETAQIYSNIAYNLSWIESYAVNMYFNRGSNTLHRAPSEKWFQNLRSYWHFCTRC